MDNVIEHNFRKEREKPATFGDLQNKLSELGTRVDLIYREVVPDSITKSKDEWSHKQALLKRIQEYRSVALNKNKGREMVSPEVLTDIKDAEPVIEEIRRLQIASRK